MIRQSLLATLLLTFSTAAVADVLTEAVTDYLSPTGPTSGVGSNVLRNLQIEQQMDLYPPKPPSHTLPSSKTIITRASIKPNGELFCRPKAHYATPRVSTYRPNGYAQCVYQYGTS